MFPDELNILELNPFIFSINFNANCGFSSYENSKNSKIIALILNKSIVGVINDSKSKF